MSTTEQYAIDKWYKPLFKKYIVDRRAATAMGRTLDIDVEALYDHTPLPVSVIPKNIKMPKITPHFIIGGKDWNYPMLIEAFEKANKPQKFARADVRAVMKLNKVYIKKTLEVIDLAQILLCPETGGQKLIRRWWLENYNPFEILKYIGVNVKLLEFLEEYQGEDFPKIELEQSLPTAPKDLATVRTYGAAVLTDEIIKGNKYKDLPDNFFDTGA